MGPKKSNRSYAELVVNPIRRRCPFRDVTEVGESRRMVRRSIFRRARSPNRSPSVFVEDRRKTFHMDDKSASRTDDAFWASGRSSQSRLNTPLFRRKQLVQEVRSIENASTWRRRRQHDPRWHICCPHSNRPHRNCCGQGSCCRDDSSRPSRSRATDHWR
jgi:hypothetical protein